MTYFSSCIRCIILSGRARWPRMDQDLLISHFRNSNSKDAIALLRERAKKKGDKETAEKAVKLLKRSGGLILKYSREGDISAQGEFVEAMGGFLRDELDCPDAHSELISHADDCERISICFQEILKTLRKSEAWKIDKDRQVWGGIERASREVSGILEMLEKKREAQIQEGSALVFSDTTIEVEGVHVDVDSAIDLMNSNIVNSIKMVAGVNGWIDKETGEILVPTRVSIDGDESFKVGTVFYLAKVWGLLESSSEELRYFGGRTRWEDLREKLTISEEQKKNAPANWLVFDIDHEYARNFLIAMKRRVRLQIEWRFSVATQTDILDNLSSPFETEVPLPPDAFVSDDELLSRMALEELFYWPVDESIDRYSGLTISEWIRAYSVLKCWAEKILSEQPEEGVLSSTRKEVVELLARGGVPKQAAHTFVDHCIFSIDSVDLFDAPFLRDQSGGLHFLYQYLPGVQAHRLVMSQFGKRGHQIQSKGRRFEKEVKAVFEERGIECRSFRYKLDGVTYDCDLCVVWGGYVFVIECKNYSLPDHRPGLEYFYMSRIGEAISQAKRIADQLKEHPEILAKEFGRKISGKRFVPIVLNSMPWSIPGKTGGAYVYDFLALGRFLGDGAIRINGARKVDGNTNVVHRHEIFNMWTGDKPSAEDFLTELEAISQHQMVKGDWELTCDPNLVSSNYGVLAIFFAPLPESVERSLSALGCSDEKIAETLRFIEGFKESQG